MIVLNEEIERELREFEEINNTAEAIIERVREEKDNEDEFRKGVMNGSILSVVADGATSNCSKLSDHYIPMGEQSDKVFHTPTGDTAAAADERLFAPRGTRTCANRGQFAGADYVTIFDKERVSIYHETNTEVAVSRGAILRGWRDKRNGLCQIPLVKEVKKFSAYTVLAAKQPTELLPERPPPTEAIHNVFELTMQPEFVRYYHSVSGFPTKATGNQKCFFTSWSGLTEHVVWKHFTESEETQKVHMRKAKSGIRSSKMRVPQPNEEEKEASESTKKHKDIFVRVYDLNDELVQLIY
mmetsp:Transcript_9409/g.15344  ORF Transcript_9409/g.15344 Transcript_9409/m.15344 type:complete len:298 (-) Transcript_9409:219-1112(-)